MGDVVTKAEIGNLNCEVDSWKVSMRCGLLPEELELLLKNVYKNFRNHLILVYIHEAIF